LIYRHLRQKIPLNLLFLGPNSESRARRKHWERKQIVQVTNGVLS
jgi:hypothetical protein